MNAVGYFLKRLGRAFGIRRDHHCRTQLSKEKQIVTEAEDLLGRLAWKDAEPIQELAGQYWKITDYERRQNKMRIEAEETDNANETAKHELATIESRYEGRIRDLKRDRSKFMEDAIGRMAEIEKLKEVAEHRLGVYRGLEMKLKVLAEDGNSYGEEIESTKDQMRQIKNDYDQRRELIEKHNVNLEKVEAQVRDMEQEIESLKAKLTGESAEVRLRIGHLSKEIAEISARIGAIQNAKNDLSFEIGQFLSENAFSRSSDIRNVLRKHRPIVSKILYFRRSIDYYARLLGA